MQALYEMVYEMKGCAETGAVTDLGMLSLFVWMDRVAGGRCVRDADKGCAVPAFLCLCAQAIPTTLIQGKLHQTQIVDRTKQL